MGFYDPTMYDRSFERIWPPDKSTGNTGESKEQEIPKDFPDRVVAELPQAQAAAINATKVDGMPF